MAHENASVHDLTGPVASFLGKIIVVTGANSGIGLAAAVGFARGGARLALVGRHQARLDAALSRVRTAVAPHGDAAQPAAYRADFASLDDVRALAARLRDAYPKIDVLANNAGGAFRNRVLTADGFETTIQVNHLAPFLLTNLLVDRLDGGRVINTASGAHTAGRLDPASLNSDGSPYRMFTVYGSSKQANILFTAEAARRWPEISSFSYHPGVVRTRFGRDRSVVAGFYKMWPFLRTPGKGADTMLWLAGAPLADLVSGAYYVDRVRREPSRAASRPDLAAALWAASEAAVKL